MVPNSGYLGPNRGWKEGLGRNIILSELCEGNVGLKMTTYAIQDTNTISWPPTLKKIECKDSPCRMPAVDVGLETTRKSGKSWNPTS